MDTQREIKKIKLEEDAIKLVENDDNKSDGTTVAIPVTSFAEPKPTSLEAMCKLHSSQICRVKEALYRQDRARFRFQLSLSTDMLEMRDSMGLMDSQIKRLKAEGVVVRDLILSVQEQLDILQKKMPIRAQLPPVRKFSVPIPDAELTSTSLSEKSFAIPRLIASTKRKHEVSQEDPELSSKKRKTNID